MIEDIVKCINNSCWESRDNILKIYLPKLEYEWNPTYDKDIIRFTGQFEMVKSYLRKNKIPYKMIPRNTSIGNGDEIIVTWQDFLKDINDFSKIIAVLLEDI